MLLIILLNWVLDFIFWHFYVPYSLMVIMHVDNTGSFQAVNIFYLLDCSNLTHKVPIFTLSKGHSLHPGILHTCLISYLNICKFGVSDHHHVHLCSQLNSVEFCYLNGFTFAYFLQTTSSVFSVLTARCWQLIIAMTSLTLLFSGPTEYSASWSQ